jgi:hypothetical protein
MYTQNVSSLAQRFANVGGTFIQSLYSDKEWYEPANGYAVGDGLISEIVGLERKYENVLADLHTAFQNIERKYADFAACDVFADGGVRHVGVWLDVETCVYVIESGVTFANLDDAIDYGIRHNQKAVWCLAERCAVTLPQLVEEVAEEVR